MNSLTPTKEQQEVFKEIAKYKKDKKQQEKIIEGINPHIFKQITEKIRSKNKTPTQMIEDEEDEEVMMYVTIFTGVEELWTQINPYLSSYESLEYDSSFIVQDDKMAFFALTDGHERDDLKEVLSKSFVN